MSCVVSAYLYGAFDCMFLSCHISEWIHTLELPECQGTLCSKFYILSRYIFEMYQRRYRIDFFFETCLRRHLKTSHERHIFWDVLETFQMRHKKGISFKMFLRGLWNASLNEDLIEIWERSFPTGKDTRCHAYLRIAGVDSNRHINSVWNASKSY